MVAGIALTFITLMAYSFYQHSTLMYVHRMRLHVPPQQQHPPQRSFCFTTASRTFTQASPSGLQVLANVVPPPDPPPLHQGNRSLSCHRRHNLPD